MIKLKEYLEDICEDFYVMIPNMNHKNEATEGIIDKLEVIYSKQIEEADLCIFIPKYIKGDDESEYIDTEKFNWMYKINSFQKIKKFFGISTIKEFEHCIRKEKEYIVYSFKDLSEDQVEYDVISKDFVLELYHFLYEKFDRNLADKLLKKIID